MKELHIDIHPIYSICFWELKGDQIFLYCARIHDAQYKDIYIEEDSMYHTYIQVHYKISQYTTQLWTCYVWGYEVHLSIMVHHPIWFCEPLPHFITLVGLLVEKKRQKFWSERWQARLEFYTYWKPKWIILEGTSCTLKSPTSCNTDLGVLVAILYFK